MNTEITAMQQFIEWYNAPGGLYFPHDVDDKMKELLETEKQQHINTYRAGDGNAYPKKHDADFAEDYFNETFKK